MDMTSCPECGAIAEIVDRHVLQSTDGPIEHARVRCVDRHSFFMPTAGLERTQPAVAGDRRAGRPATR
ncbi:MAG: hypothetical protein J2P22_06670 [Nocardioides sp.]|nr:hypothetical protein [Nocardioides sp.]